MEYIKYNDNEKGCYFYNNRDMYDIKTNNIVNKEPLPIKIGDMVYYFKTSEYHERFMKVYNENDTDEIKSRKMYVVFNLIMKDKNLEKVSWDKLQDIIFFNTRNNFLKKDNINKDKDYLEKHYNDIITSDILFNPNEIYVICKIDSNTGDYYYTYSRIQNLIDATRENMNQTPEEFTKTYWRLKLEYNTKQIDNNIIVDFTTL